MKSFKIHFTGVNMAEAMEQVEKLEGIDFKQRNCLLLLTEEMFSMMASVLENREASFEIERDGNAFSLGLLTKATVSKEAREQYMSVSTDGKNIAYKGLKGKMIALYESLANEDAIVPGAMAFDPHLGYSELSQMWQLSLYMKNIPDAEKKEAWDGMEKSIIGTFSDDILIGVRENQVEMIVKKSFD